MVRLSQLFIYPVKSMQATQCSHTQVMLNGFAFDRIFMLTDETGHFITAREYPELVCFSPTMVKEGVTVKAPDGASVSVKFSDFSLSMQPTDVWQNQFTSHVAPDLVNKWFSRYLNKPVQLRWVGETPTRRVKRRPDIPLSFADGYPFLLFSESSFQLLQDRCPTALDIRQLRPNLVVDGCPPFAEDSWKTIRIGEVTFDLVKPCTRCILTTVNVATGKMHPMLEPLASLQQFRTTATGKIDFGQNMVARNPGVIRIGDPIEILETHNPPTYINQAEPQQVNQHNEPLKDIVIKYQGQSFIGNNQQTLLEQLEQHNIRINYSCRAGICGYCKLRLVDGNVRSLKKEAINNDGVILACSCVPVSNVILENG